MKFYDRKLELQELQVTRKIAYEIHSQLTVVTGRRRIGKTMLVNKSCEDTTMVYLFVARTTEATLCKDFSAVILNTLGEFIPKGVTKFAEIFEILLNIGTRRNFTLFIDEFQEFYRVNPVIFSEIQNLWDRYKDKSHIHFVAAGSVQTLMHKVFMDYGEPLYGRCDSILKLRPFTPSVLKEIMHDYHPNYKNDDLLALYTITGGVPRYIEILVDRKKFTAESMIKFVLSPNSIFLEEGNILLIQEFGKEFGKYFSVLGAISRGKTTMAEISDATGIESCGGLIERLEQDYDIVSKVRPVFAKPRAQSVRYEIYDNFLRFWFRYVFKNQSFIQNGMIDRVAEIAIEDYPTYSGLVLERYFREKLAEEGRYYIIGGWWESGNNGNNPNEIDIVAVEPGDKYALIAEVKRNRKNFHQTDFMRKVEQLANKHLPHAEIDAKCLSLEDM